MIGLKGQWRVCSRVGKSCVCSSVWVCVLCVSRVIFLFVLSISSIYI